MGIIDLMNTQSPVRASTDKFIKFAITISPPSRVKYSQDRNPNKNLYLDDTLVIQHILKYIKVPTYIIYPELDEKGRLHYHGIIDLDYNQYVRYMKYAQFKLPKLGHVDIKPLDTFIDNLRWITYIKKEWGTTKDILEITTPLLSKHGRLKQTDITILL